MRTKLMLMTMLGVAAFAAYAQAVEQMKQGSTYPLVFFMADANDHITGKTGLSSALASNVKLWTNGSIVTVSSGISEIDSANAPGWYKVSGNSSYSSTLGPLVLHATATGADPADKSFEVVAYDPSDPQRMGLTALPAANAGASGGLPTGDSSGRVDVAKLAGSTTPVTNLGTIYNTDFASLYDSTNHVWKADAARIDGTAWSTHASGMVAGDLRDISGAGVNATSAQLGVNVVNFGGSAGTFSSGRPEVSLEADQLSAITGGYNHVLHVGSGQAYANVTDAQTAATAGDLIVVHPGTYGDYFIGKEGITYYLAYGATLDAHSSPEDNDLFNGGVNFRVLGHGWIKQWDTDGSIIQVGSAAVDIKCDTLDAGNYGGTAIAVSNSASRLTIEAERVIGPTETGTLIHCSSGRATVQATDVETGSTLGDGTIFDVVGADALVALRASHIEHAGSDDFITGSAGTVIIDAPIRCTDSSTNGLTAPSGVTVLAPAGGIKVPSGRPSLSGSGTFIVSDAFAFDTASATASNIVKTTAGKIATYIPNAAPGAAGGLATVDSNNRIAGIQGSVNNLNNLDAAVSSRLAAASYTAPDNASITTIKSFLDGAPTFSEAMNGQGYTMDLASRLDKVAPTLLLSTTIATISSTAPQMTFTLHDGPTENNVLNGAIVIVTDNTVSPAKKAVGLVKSYVGGTSHTVTLVTDPGIFTMAAGNTIDVVAGGPAVPLWLAH
ncbi:MAG TPA: hypothetical protein VGM76_12925 [Lacipirellulaceae bacterium]